MTVFLERNIYFAGQVLGPDDFQREQAYFIARLRRHNRFAHGWGVVRGLEVQVHNGRLRISPGLAIDCEGNELELPVVFEGDLSGQTMPCWVCIRFTEVAAAPVPVPGREEESQFTVIQESAEIVLEATNPCAHHASMTAGSAGCGQRHPVVLARLSRAGTAWRVRLAQRQRQV